MKLLKCLASFSCLLLGCVACGGAQSAAPDAGQGEKVRVMTFNIRYHRAPNDGPNAWEFRRDMVADLIRRTGADTVGLQEAELPQVEYLRGKLKDEYEFIVMYSDGKTGKHSNALLYRKKRWKLDQSGSFWLSDKPDVPDSKGWGNKSPRLCTWGRFVDKKTGKAFYHYNTHFDHESPDARIRSAMLIANRVADRTHKDPFFVTGDLNAREDTPAMRFFKGEKISYEGVDRGSPVPMTDTFRAVHPDATQIATYNGFDPTKTFAKIDYIFFGGAGKILDAQIDRYSRDGRYPSDHFPMTVDVCLNPKPAAP